MIIITRTREETDGRVWVTARTRHDAAVTWAPYDGEGLPPFSFHQQVAEFHIGRPVEYRLYDTARKIVVYKTT